MAITPDKNDSEQTKRPRTEVFEREDAKRRTSISLSQQADDDINELMRRSRQRVPGNVIADAVRLMRILPPDFVALMLMFSEQDKGEDRVALICRNMMRAYYELEARNGTDDWLGQEASRP